MSCRFWWWRTEGKCLPSSEMYLKDIYKVMHEETLNQDVMVKWSFIQFNCVSLKLPANWQVTHLPNLFHLPKPILTLGECFYTVLKCKSCAVSQFSASFRSSKGNNLMCLWFVFFVRLFGGLFLDIKRKAPHFLSDFTDALSLQCLASFLFLYCACMSPVITFGGLLGEATEGRIVRHACSNIHT